MLIGCAPETFMIDLGNVVTSAQKRVIFGNCAWRPSAGEMFCEIPAVVTPRRSSPKETTTPE